MMSQGDLTQAHTQGCALAVCCDVQEEEEEQGKEEEEEEEEEEEKQETRPRDLT